jgi:GMC oxidoreductase
VDSGDYGNYLAFNVIQNVPGDTDLRGTCAMKPRDKGGVVDKDLNVYGTQRLKIAGMPRIS